VTDATVGGRNTVAACGCLTAEAVLAVLAGLGRGRTKVGDDVAAMAVLAAATAAAIGDVRIAPGEG